jgi:hypothetical protein
MSNDVDAGDEHAATRMNLDEADVLESRESFTNGRPSHPKLFAQLAFGDHRTGRQTAADDHLLDARVSGIG